MRKIQMITSDTLLLSIGFFIGNIIPRMEIFKAFTVVLVALTLALLAADGKTDRRRRKQNTTAERKLRRAG